MGVHLSRNWQECLVCPKCKSLFGSGLSKSIHKQAVQNLECVYCNVKYEVKDGIINFGVTDAFYDEHGFVSTGRDFSNTLIGNMGLYFARNHYLYEIFQTIPPGSSMIEVGCGGGSRYLASHYQMLGVEVSATSVRSAACTYPSAIQATTTQLPVSDSCADAVVSSYVLEHLGSDSIERFLSEMARVLKPNGRMVHCFDLDASGPFHQWAKKQPWYESIFVSSRGHFGLRSLEEWQGLIGKAGFKIQGSRTFCKTWFQDFSIWSALNNPLVKGMPNILGKTAASINRTVGVAGNVAITIFDDLLGSYLPEHWASKVILSLQKI